MIHEREMITCIFCDTSCKFISLYYAHVLNTDADFHRYRGSIEIEELNTRTLPRYLTYAYPVSIIKLFKKCIEYLTFKQSNAMQF